jgi:hypothetical protein
MLRKNKRLYARMIATQRQTRKEHNGVQLSLQYRGSYALRCFYHMDYYMFI